MLDPTIIQNEPDRVRSAIANKRENPGKADVDRWLELRKGERSLIQEVETLRAQQNRASKEIGQRKRSGEDAAELLELMGKLKAELVSLEQNLQSARDEMESIALWFPNIPHADVPVGPEESHNQLIRTWKDPAIFDFEPQPHWDLIDTLGLQSTEASGRLAGSGFSLLLGDLARLQRALISFMLDMHIADGWTEVAPPVLSRTEPMIGTGQIPKLADDMYRIDRDDLFLIPTAEVPITNILAGQILSEKELPLGFTGHTRCFRREAGAAGKDTRGLIRVHEFSKVELVKFVSPDRSYEELESLVGQAEKVLQALEIPYRLLLLSTEGMSFAGSKTYDLEIWAPGVERWLEVSSCTNFEDFQTRRIGIRFRPTSGGKPRFVHTLNGSAIALPRLLIALIENGQQADGSIRLPEAIRSRMGGQEFLKGRT
ncbi:MAG: serine--tRNA ligase [Planctomycetota bacterium]|jgi:seryl-tRNA synthetase|nr:serine--tRNA ligase [Planctomycetota bacterium]